MFDDEKEAVLLLSSMPYSWKNLVITISNSAPKGMLAEGLFWALWVPILQSLVKVYDAILRKGSQPRQFSQISRKSTCFEEFQLKGWLVR